ncbi:phage distal tail protein [Halalkalibacterium halodurans]|uniref:phage distal tail protein n=1 Tax=Halalkalibacterium halodurans TaxID=86665 RepID=UPI002E24731E|nr:phage tail family protein [Halalkalibacterium halodurans]MED4162481.1 phage tail family protein [Halalkalibacterium halodurans]
MRRLTFTNARGESVVFYRSPFFIERLSGIGEVNADLQGQRSPYMDGETYIDTILHPRFVDLEGAITYRDLSEIKQARSQIIRVCNPKLGLGRITLEMDGDIKEIMGVPDGVPVFPERGEGVYQQFMVTFKCPNPYWQDLTSISRDLRAYEGKFTFPFEFPVQFGIEGDSTTITNAGNADASVILTIQGPVRNPMVINQTTGQYIRVLRSIQSNETLYIDTNPYSKKVEIRRGSAIIKAMGSLDHDSDFWQLVVGPNRIRYVADEGVEEAVVSIHWRSMYTGV